MDMLKIREYVRIRILGIDLYMVLFKILSRTHALWVGL